MKTINQHTLNTSRKQSQDCKNHAKIQVDSCENVDSRLSTWKKRNMLECNAFVYRKMGLYKEKRYRNG